MDLILGVAALLTAGALARSAGRRLDLSRAKHRSLHGHPRISRLLARLVPACRFGEPQFFGSDDAPMDVQRQRRLAFQRLARLLRHRAPKSVGFSAAVEASVSDLQFVNTYRVPPQYGQFVKQHLKIGACVKASAGVLVTDLDGNDAYDLTGSYGANVFGYDFYKYVMGAMNEFLRRLDDPAIRALYRDADALWTSRADALNARFAREHLPVNVVNLSSKALTGVWERRRQLRTVGE
jgi:glutamate-1-semialdehyde 2,1-aminomutase